MSSGVIHVGELHKLVLIVWKNIMQWAKHMLCHILKMLSLC